MSNTIDVKIEPTEIGVDLTPQHINFNFLYAGIGFGYTQGKLEFKQDLVNIDFGVEKEVNVNVELGVDAPTGDVEIKDVSRDNAAYHLNFDDIPSEIKEHLKAVLEYAREHVKANGYQDKADGY